MPLVSWRCWVACGNLCSAVTLKLCKSRPIRRSGAKVTTWKWTLQRRSPTGALAAVTPRHMLTNVCGMPQRQSSFCGFWVFCIHSEKFVVIASVRAVVVIIVLLMSSWFVYPDGAIRPWS
eukprot:2053073-Amphidinium_carterae.1